MILKIDSFIMSLVGLISKPRGSLSFRPLAVPLITRMPPLLSLHSSYLFITDQTSRLCSLSVTKDGGAIANWGMDAPLSDKERNRDV
jgi:hypothetical protein